MQHKQNMDYEYLIKIKSLEVFSADWGTQIGCFFGGVVVTAFPSMPPKFRVDRSFSSFHLR